jgi:hypothetical protein
MKNTQESMSTANDQFAVLPSFLNEHECRQARANIDQTPMYSSQDPVYRCRTTCYGGVAGIEPHEPMPAWMATIRRRIELVLGVNYTHFNAAAVVCLTVDSDCVQWHALPRQHVGDLARMAVLTLDGTALFAMRKSALQLNAPSSPLPSAPLTPGQLLLTRPGIAVRNQWRLDRQLAAARTGKRKTTDSEPSWHIVFFRLLDGDSVRQRAAQSLYQTFRYGAHLAQVLREPHHKLVLQVSSGTDSRKRQLLIEHLMPVKKERTAAVTVKQET